MSDRPASSPFLGPGLAAAVLGALLIPYVAGYLMLGSTGTGGTTLFRIYKYRWQEIIYRPAAAAESVFTGRSVIAAHRTPEAG